MLDKTMVDAIENETSPSHICLPIRFFHIEAENTVEGDTANNQNVEISCFVQI
jgi:hypothetical protein